MHGTQGRQSTIAYSLTGHAERAFAIGYHMLQCNIQCLIRTSGLAETCTGLPSNFQQNRLVMPRMVLPLGVVGYIFLHLPPQRLGSEK